MATVHGKNTDVPTDLQGAYDNGDGTITTDAGKPVEINGPKGLGLGITPASDTKIHVVGLTTNDSIRADYGFDFNPVEGPSTTVGGPPILNLVVGTPGNVDNGLHYYWYCFVTAVGETRMKVLGGGVPPSITIADKTVSGQVDITFPVSPDYRVIARKLFRSKVGESYWDGGHLLATINDNTTTTYRDNIADSALGAANQFHKDDSTGVGYTVNGVQSIFISPYQTIMGYNAGEGVFANQQASNNVIYGQQAGEELTTGATNNFFGMYAGRDTTSGSSNTFIGDGSGSKNTTGGSNVGLGRNCFGNSQTGGYNTIIGTLAWFGATGQSGSNNVMVGSQAGRFATNPYRCVYLGYKAGYNQTSNDDLLIIDNADRGSAAAEVTDALIYGVFNTTATSQSLNLNANTTIRGNVVIGGQEPGRDYLICFNGESSIGCLYYYEDEALFSFDQDVEIRKNLTIGFGTAGVDYTLTFNGETSDGVLTWMEDEAEFNFDSDVVVEGDLTVGSGAAGVDYTLTFNGETNDGVLTWMEDEAEFNFDSDMTIDGDLTVGDGTTGVDFKITFDGESSDGTITWMEDEAEFVLNNDVVIGAGATGVDYVLRFDGETSDGKVTWMEDESEFRFDSKVVVQKNLTIGSGETGVDYTITVDGETNDGILRWMEDEDYFKFFDDVMLTGGENLVLDTSLGSKIGTASNQKMAFWGATQVVRPSSTGETSGFTAGSGTGVNDDSTFTGNTGSTAYRISDIVKHLKTIGLIAP